MLGSDLRSVWGASLRWEERLDRPGWLGEKLFELVGMNALARGRVGAAMPVCCEK